MPMSDPPRLRRPGAALTVLIVVLGLTGCARLTPPPLRDGDDVYDQIHTAPFLGGGPGARRVEPLPASARKARFWFLARTVPRRPMPAVGKLDPTLQDWIANRPGSDVVEVVVTFVDTVPMPRFPRLDRRRPRTDPVNLARLDSTASAIARLRLARSAQYAADTLDMKANFGASVLATYWLFQGALVRITLGQVDPLARRPNVVYIRPNIGPGPPQGNPRAGDDIIEARIRIGSDPYVEQGYGTGWMALLDTGVHTTHRLLWDEANATTRLCMVADCVPWSAMTTGGYLCSTFSPQGATAEGGDTDDEGHGTSTAAILVGNGRELPGMSGSAGRFGGVTRAELDCFRVYGPDNKLSPHAAFLGFQAALARGNQIVVAEMQDTTVDMADVAKVADQAYEGGVPVVAANGNEQSWGPGVPARGRRVMGVGAFMFPGEQPIAGLARGPTADDRVKPDLLAPSHTETAANKAAYPYPSPTSAMKTFGLTSGATPYAAGAALVLQNWLDEKEGGPVDAGQVYAMLLLSGDEVGPFPADDATGVGRLRLPEVGTGKYGKTWVSVETRHVDVPIEIGTGTGVGTLAAAIWWPESTLVAGGSYVDTHNDLGLEIRSPGWFGGVEAASDGPHGVFERASVTRPGGLSGTWVLRITSKSMRTPWPQVVYWSASLSP